MTRKPTYKELEQRIKELEKEAAKRERTEEALKESQRYTRGLIEASLDALVTISAEGRITDLNHATELITGLSRNEIIGTEFSDYFTDPNAARKGYQQVLQDGYVRDYLLEIEHRDGKIIPVLYNASVYKDAQGHGAGVFAAARDITEQKQAQEALQESEEKWRSLAETAPCVILSVQRDGTIQFLNRTVGNYTAEDTIGTKVWDYVPPDHHSVMREAIEHVFQTGDPVGYEILGAGPEGLASAWYMTQLGPIVRDGRVVAVTIVSTDITEQKKAEEALRESEERYRTLFEDSRDAVYITTREGKLVDVNRSFLDLFCIAREEIPDLNVRQLYVNPDDRPRFQNEIEKKGSVKDFPMRLCKKDRTEMDCLLTSTVWRASDGSTLGYQGIIRDITKRKMTEKALREREAELEIKTNSLEEVNTALRVLLKRRDEDKRELEEKVLVNVKELVFPFLEKVKKRRLGPEQMTYIHVLESNLNDIISPFLRTLSAKYLNLTPTEIQIANLIKEGKISKEIAELLNLSSKTINTHRRNIRMKLGIKNKKINLRSNLLSLQK